MTTPANTPLPVWPSQVGRPILAAAAFPGGFCRTPHVAALVALNVQRAGGSDQPSPAELSSALRQLEAEVRVQPGRR